MKAPKFLTAILGFLVIAAFSRKLFDAGDLSLISLINDLQAFNFDISPVQKALSIFEDGSLISKWFVWDETQTGLDGFFFNLKGAVTAFYSTFSNLISVLFEGLWCLVKLFVSFIVKIFDVLLSLFGILD